MKRAAWMLLLLAGCKTTEPTVVSTSVIVSYQPPGAPAVKAEVKAERKF